MRDLKKWRDNVEDQMEEIEGKITRNVMEEGLQGR